MVEQIAVSFHRTTNPMNPHKEAKLEREYETVLSSLSDNTASRKRVLIKLQDLNQRWTKQSVTPQKKQVHYSMVRGSKIKQAIQRALNPCQRSPIQVWDKSTDPPKLATDPEHVGRVFSESLSKLGGDPAFVVGNDKLNQFLINVPECTPGAKHKAPPLPTPNWLIDVTKSASPSKAMGDDEIKYYIVSLSTDALQKMLLRALHYILVHTPPPAWSRARVCLLYKEEDFCEPSNYRFISPIQTLVKLTAVWQCQQLSEETGQHGLLHPCQHGGLQQQRCVDHILDIVARTLSGKGRLYHLYIEHVALPMDTCGDTLPPGTHGPGGRDNAFPSTCGSGSRGT